MKYLFCLFALALSGTSMAAIDPPQETTSSIKPIENSANKSVHRPMTELKFVLVTAPQEKLDEAQFDVDDQHSAIYPALGQARHSVSLGGGDVNPNVFVCSGWGCRGN